MGAASLSGTCNWSNDHEMPLSLDALAGAIIVASAATADLPRLLVMAGDGVSANGMAPVQAMRRRARSGQPENVSKDNQTLQQQASDAQARRPTRRLDPKSADRPRRPRSLCRGLAGPTPMGDVPITAGPTVPIGRDRQPAGTRRCRSRLVVVARCTSPTTAAPT